MTNDDIINDVITDLKVSRQKCDLIKMDHKSTIKIVEAKSDILRAINKLRTLFSKVY